MGAQISSSLSCGREQCCGKEKGAKGTSPDGGKENAVFNASPRTAGKAEKNPDLLAAHDRAETEKLAEEMEERAKELIAQTEAAKEELPLKLAIEAIKQLPGRPEKLNRVFELCDVDNSGTLDEEEFMVIGRAWNQAKFEAQAKKNGGVLSAADKKKAKWTKSQNRVAFAALADAAGDLTEDSDNPQQGGIVPMAFQTFYLKNLASVDDATFDCGCGLVVMAMDKKSKDEEEAYDVVPKTV